jgi:DNA-binding Lrp family transcriptional regulator
MKNIAPKLIGLLKQGSCTPQIAQIARKLKEPSTTIHYNIKKLEREGAIKSYKAVFDYKKIDEGHCTYILVNLAPEHYGEPEQIAKEIAKHPHVESIDIITGDYELIIKLRSKDIDEYYEFVKHAIKRHGFAKVVSLTSLKQVKTEFVEI